MRDVQLYNLSTTADYFNIYSTTLVVNRQSAMTSVKDGFNKLNVWSFGRYTIILAVLAMLVGNFIVDSPLWGFERELTRQCRSWFKVSLCEYDQCFFRSIRSLCRTDVQSRHDSSRARYVYWREQRITDIHRY